MRSVTAALCKISKVLGSRLSADQKVDHINTYAMPQAIIVDGSVTEEEFFKTAMQQEAEKLKLTLIEIPHGGAKKMGWMTKLDGAALSGMADPRHYVDPLLNYV